jgi:hypothetical protein
MMKTKLLDATQLYKAEQVDVNTALQKVTNATADLNDGLAQN